MRSARTLIWAAVVFSAPLAYQCIAVVSEVRWARKATGQIAVQSAAPQDAARSIQAAVFMRLHVPKASDASVSRSFARASARETWESGRSFCGEATRLIIVLLRANGIPAMRVHLTRSTPHVGHIAVLYQVKKQWYLLDSFNAPPGFREWTLQNKKPFSELIQLTKPAGGGFRFDGHAWDFGTFSYYDFSRLTRLHFRLEMLSVPSQWFVGIMEYPSRIRLLLVLAIELTMVAVGMMILRLRGLRTRSAGGSDSASLPAKD